MALRIDHFGDALQHGFAIEQEQPAAGDQQKCDSKCKDRDSHSSSSNIHVDDFANDQTANDDHCGSGIQQLDPDVALPQKAHHVGVDEV